MAEREGFNQAIFRMSLQNGELCEMFSVYAGMSAFL